MRHKKLNAVSIFDAEAFLTSVGPGHRKMKCKAKQAIFRQGDPAEAIFYIETGKVRLSVLSKTGKEAVIGLLEAGNFFGEACIIGQPLQLATATPLAVTTVYRIEKSAMVRMLDQQPALSRKFTAFLLARNMQIEEDLVDQLFNSSEKRLARILLRLAQFGKDGKLEPVISKISQEVLAAQVGTTRSRINYFMNKFRKLGLIEYNGDLKINSALINVVLHD